MMCTAEATPRAAQVDEEEEPGRGKRRRVVAGETRPHKVEGEKDGRRRRVGTETPPVPSSSGSGSGSESGTRPRLHPAATAAGEEARAQLAINIRRMLSVEKEIRGRIAEQIQIQAEGPILTLEDTFCDIDDSSAKSQVARKVALGVSQSIVSLSSFAGRKRIRVCSGFVIRWNDSTSTGTILTSAALVRPPCRDDVRVEVLLPSGDISHGQVSMIDFHHNIGLVEVTSNFKLQEAVILKDIIEKGDVLALGRAYEGGLLMCSRGKINNRANIFECSELLVSSCKITMAGTGGPLVNFDGHVVGLNFFEEDQTPFLSMAIVSRCLEHHQRFGRIIRPWLGFWFTSIQVVPLSHLEHIYKKLSDVDDGLYISNVAEGSPADIAGICKGDILIKCGGNFLSTAPEFGAMLMDICKEHMEAYDQETVGDFSEKRITVEIVIKRQKDGSMVEKTLSAGLIEEFNYNSWPTPIPSYKARRDTIGRWKRVDREALLLGI
uniref:PDZ domain-containing protein n=1 Tax=Oryza punctata TaxID=4537 RepID=A0A0E0JH33_ORYPU